MSHDPNDVVRVYSGPLFDVEAYQQVLKESGIESNVVGTSLTASFGSAIPDSIELWVHQSDVEKAAAAIRYHDENKGRHAPAENERFPHPTSDSAPGAAPHRKEPHVKQDPFTQ